MRRALILAGLLTAAGGFAGAEPPRDLPRFAGTVDVVESLEVLAPVDLGQPVRVRFPVGELVVTTADVTAVRATLSVGCGRLSPALCDKYRGRLRLAAQERRGAVEVRLAGLPKWKLRKLRLAGDLVAPRWAPLEVRLGIGEADVRAGDGDLVVVMGIGDLTVRATRDRVGSVRARTGIGDASVSGDVQRAGERRKLIGAAVTWLEGTGPVDIDIGLRIGDASVVLD